MTGFIKSIKSDIQEIIDSKSILRSLIARNLYGRYKNSILGFAWNFVSPLIFMLMYYIVFSEIRTGAGAGIENKWVFISTAIFLFSFLTHCITGGTTVFISNSAMIKKMYFPREILILANSISSMIVCVIGYAIVLIALIITGCPINWVSILFLPIILLLALIFGIGCLFLLSSITVYVRDIQYALGTTGIMFFVLTPMRYMASEATGIVSVLIWYNPLTYYVEVAHEILYFGLMPDISYLLICVLLSIVSLSLGYYVFRKLRHGFVKRL